MIKSLYEPFRHWSAKGSVYVYSDTHFGDDYMAQAREFDNAELFDKYQYENLKSRIHKNDTLVLLGDVGDVDYIKKLDCYKVLVMGNHDAGRQNYMRMKWDVHIGLDKEYEEAQECGEVPKTIVTDEAIERRQQVLDRLRDKHILEHELKPNYVRMSQPLTWAHRPSVSNNYDYLIAHFDNKLFDEVYEGPLMIAPKIMLSHEPCSGPWFNIHGHEHNGTRDYNPFSKTGFNVAGEHVNYYPISLGDLIKEGFVGKVDDIHRLVIDEATERARKRGYKLS